MCSRTEATWMGPGTFRADECARTVGCRAEWKGLRYQCVPVLSMKKRRFEVGTESGFCERRDEPD